jgi:hypothetical protein
MESKNVSPLTPEDDDQQQHLAISFQGTVLCTPFSGPELTSGLSASHHCMRLPETEIKNSESDVILHMDIRKRTARHSESPT